MEDLIKKLIKVDEDARKQVEDAEKARADVMNLLEEKRAQLVKEAQEKFSKDLADAKSKEQARMDDAFSEENLKANNQKIIDKMEKNYSENCSDWVKTIVEKVIA